MANRISEVLNAVGMSLTIPCAGMSRVGIGVQALSGTGATVGFFVSTDGVNFISAKARPFASGTTVATVTTTGNWEFDVQNYVAVQVQLTAGTTPSATIVLAASIDGSYQIAFLAQTSVFQSQEVTAGATNVITAASQTNRTWRVRTISGSFNIAASATVALTVADGSNTIFKTQIPLAAGPWNVTLPADPNTPGQSGGGLVGTGGNAMTVTLAAPGGSVVSALNCEFVPA